MALKQLLGQLGQLVKVLSGVRRIVVSFIRSMLTQYWHKCVSDKVKGQTTVDTRSGARGRGKNYITSGEIALCAVQRDPATTGSQGK